MTPATDPTLYPIATVRHIQRPYFLLTTADGVGHFLREERPGLNTVNQALFSRREPLVALLAPALLKKPETHGGRRHYEIHYDIDPEIQRGAVPLTSIPEALIAEYEAAAAGYLGRDGQRHFSPHEKNLRECFRVPDPDLEPDCYWLYGTPGNRRLLILWGCEKTEKTSIPLLPDPRQPGKNLLDWFRQHRLGWAGKQQEMIRLLQTGAYPLRRFLALPVADHKGALKSYTLGDRDHPAAAFRRARHVPAAWIAAFAAAAADFYAAAAPESASISAAEKELRVAFKLPDPEKHPRKLLRLGRRYAVALPADLSEQDGLHLCADDKLGLPPMTRNREGSGVVPPTFVERLRERVTPVKLYATLGCVAGILLIAGLVGLYRMADRSPPRVASIIAENDPERITVVFTESVAPGSLQAPADAEPRFRVRALTGKVHEVVAVSANADNPARVVLTVDPPLQDAGEYTVVVREIADTAMRANRMPEPLTMPFTWFDRLPPVLGEVSAEGSNEQQLLLFFNKPLEQASATRTINYRIPGFRVLNAEFHLDDPALIVLTAERDARGAGAGQGFIHLGEYEIEVSGIRDASSSRNPVADGARKSFVFRDTVPPRVLEVDASENQWSVHVRFSELLDQATAENAAHYTVATEDGAAVAVQEARLLADGKGVALTTDPLYAGVAYVLGVRGIRDRSPERNEMSDRSELPFNFRGRLDETPPMIGEIRVADDRLELVVVFNESVRVGTAEVAANYTIPESGADVLSARRLGTDNRAYLLRLDRALPQAQRQTLRVSGVMDRVGNATDRAELPFQVPGVAWLDATLQPALAEILSPTRIRLRFNDRLTPASANRIENYRLPEPYLLEAVAYEHDAMAVVLELAPNHPLQAGSLPVEARNLRLFADPDTPQATVRFVVNVR